MLRTRVRTTWPAGLIISFVVAALLTLVGQLELLIPSLAPRYGQPAPTTLRMPHVHSIEDMADGQGDVAVETTRITIPSGTTLRRGERSHRAVVAMEQARRPLRWQNAVSGLLLNLFVCLGLSTYLRRFGQTRVRLVRTQLGIFGLLVSLLIFSKAILLFTAIPEFWIPACALPLWIAVAFDRRTAFLLGVCQSLLVAGLLRFDLMLFSVGLVQSGGAALVFLGKRRSHRQIISASAMAGVLGAVVYACLSYLTNGHFTIAGDLGAMTGSNLVACVGGGLMSGLFGRLLYEPAERAMGHVTRDRLLDLTDLEQPLLKRMSTQAQGSWEHARAMANLAEAAAAAIGADALLTRVGAYYHDLGKTIQPKYFVENLQHGERSPHEDLEPDVSADAIMAHVVMGTQILREGGIPEPVVEFAYTHHGTQAVEYFWHKCQARGNPKGLTIDQFRYPGMKPQTKETAILMLVDSIEAASRTIVPPEREKFEEMIRRILFTKLSAGQLDDSGLSVEDLRILVTRMSATLVNIYHGRVRYPWQDKPQEPRAEAESTPTPERTSVLPPRVH